MSFCFAKYAAGVDKAAWRAAKAVPCPCHNCTERYPACHGSCGKYATYKAKQSNVKAAVIGGIKYTDSVCATLERI